MLDLACFANHAWRLDAYTRELRTHDLDVMACLPLLWVTVDGCLFDAPWTRRTDAGRIVGMLQVS